MSLFVELRQIASSVTSLSDAVDRMSTAVGDGALRSPRSERRARDGPACTSPPLDFGVRFSQSQEDVRRSMPSSRLRAHLSLPELDKTSDAAGPRPERPAPDEPGDAAAGSAERLDRLVAVSVHRRPHFDDDGRTHPMTFVENCKHYISEVKIPEEKRLAFVISCLEGVPLLWARCFREEFVDVESFFEAFEEEFWGPERQKTVLCDMKLGKYDERASRMSMSEYFLHKVADCRRLTPPPSDLEIVYSLAAHFPAAVELELRLAPRPTLRQAHRALRRREREAPDSLPNYLYRMCEDFQRGRRPDAPPRDDAHA